MENKTVGIVKSLINLVGVTAGIIITAIGAIMFLDAVFKLYIFDIKQDRYTSLDYRCQQYDIGSIEANRILGNDLIMGPIPAVGISPRKTNERESGKELTEEEKEFLQKKFKECKEEARKSAEENFRRGEKMDIASGLAFVLVGLPLLYFYQRRRREDK